MMKQTLGIALFGILLVACAQPNAPQPVRDTPIIEVETEELVAIEDTAELSPTSLPEPTEAPTETPKPDPPTVTAEPTDVPEPTTIPLETFETTVDIQATLPTGDPETVRAEARDLVEYWSTSEDGFIVFNYGDSESIGVGDHIAEVT